MSARAGSVNDIMTLWVWRLDSTATVSTCL